MTALSLPMAPYDGRPYNVPEAQNYPNPAVINNYYGTYGPPLSHIILLPRIIFTSIPGCLPPSYSPVSGFPVFSCFTIFTGPLSSITVWYFVSNHFNDIRSHRVFRVDPWRDSTARLFGELARRGGGLFFQQESRIAKGGFSMLPTKGRSREREPFPFTLFRSRGSS